jgi:XTP/dITP diphosphohydrolase
LDKDHKAMEGELGDLLLHVFFYAKIGSESGAFDMATVANAISEKLINRHPHIYGDLEVADEEEVKKNWEQLKLKEGKESVLSGVPKALPALIKANRIQDKVAGVGFDWEAPEQVFDKVKEELDELSEAVTLGQKQDIESEFGDVLFSMINYARFLGLDPEAALERTNKKFIKRFKYLEQQAKAQNKTLKSMTLEEMDVYWEQAKNL